MVSRVVLVAVGSFDRRASCAAEYASVLRADEHRALHVDTDVDETYELACAWMTDQPFGLPLDIVDDIGGVDVTLEREVTSRLTRGALEVVVLVGRVSMGSAKRRWLHDDTGGAIERAVRRIPRASCVFVPVGVDA
jgi:hypothetical protein